MVASFQALELFFVFLKKILSLDKTIISQFDIDNCNAYIRLWEPIQTEGDSEEAPCAAQYKLF